MRARVRVRLDAVDPESGEVRETFHTLDLSSGGALCASDREVPIRTQLRLRIALPDEAASDPVLTDAIVLRAERAGDSPAHSFPAYRVALYFLNLRAADRQRLQRFVFSALSSNGLAAPAAATAPAAAPAPAPRAAAPRRPRRK